MVLLIAGSFMPQAFAQNGCELTGPGRLCVNGGHQFYTSFPDQSSSFNWSIVNSSGASATIVNVVTAPDGFSSVAEIDPGSTTGSFLLKTIVTASNPQNPDPIQECSRSVPVRSPIVSLQKFDPACYGQTGSITATISSGFPLNSGGFSYYLVSIDGGAFTQMSSPHTFTGLGGGSHTVDVQDYKGVTGPPSCDCAGSCTASNSVEIIVPAPNPVNLTCANDQTELSCQSQSAIDAAYAAWLLTASSSGGTNPNFTNDAPQSAPAACGGSVTVTWTVTSDCEAPHNCSATFTVTNAPEVIFTCGDDVTVPACSSQSDVDAAYAAFVASTTASGGCNGNLSNDAPATAPAACGGSVDVTWTYTSSCDAPHSCTRNFTVTNAPQVTFTCGDDVTVPACSSQADVDAAYAAFLASTTASGGCGGNLSNDGPQTAPSKCGGSVNVTWTYTTTCPSAILGSCTKTFTVTAPQISASHVDGSCATGLGSASVTYTCANGATYAWSKDGIAIANSNSASLGSLESGLYRVTATSASGCSATASTTVTTTHCASLGDYVWYDANGNGVQDAGETGVPGVTVTLYTCSNNTVVAVQVTNLNGLYLFTGLNPGSYYVGFSTLPTGYTFSPKDMGGDDTKDSDPTVSTGKTGCVTLTDGQTNLTLDAGLVVVACRGFRTQTQGGWGAEPKGNNPGKYLHAHFAAAFPNGLTVGCTNKLKLTSAQAVTDFLPSGSTPRALPAGTLTNPGGSYSNVLAGQVVALKLNVTFDLVDPAFSPSTTHLNALIIASGTFAGWTVQQLLNEAEKALGGCASIYSYSQLTDAADKINQNYDDGTAVGSYLICPTNSKTDENDGVQSQSVIDENGNMFNLRAYPNPFSDQIHLRIESSNYDDLQIRIFDMLGQLIQDNKYAYSSDITIGTTLSAGVYMIQVVQGENKKVLQVIKSE